MYRPRLNAQLITGAAHCHAGLHKSHAVGALRAAWRRAGVGVAGVAMDTYGPWVGLMGHRGNDCGLVDETGYIILVTFVGNLRSKSKCWPMLYMF